MVDQEVKQGKTPESNGAQAILEQKPKINDEEKERFLEKYRKELVPEYFEIAKDLQTLFPNLFSSSAKEIKPLERRIYINIKKYFKEHDLPERYRIWKKKGVSFLHWFTSRPFYLAAVIKEKYRYDLTGKGIEKIPLQHKDYSVKKLLNVINRQNLAIKAKAEKNKEKIKPDNKLKYLFLICKLYVEQRRDIAFGKDFTMPNPKPKEKKAFSKQAFKTKKNEIKPQVREKNYIKKEPIEPKKIEETNVPSSKPIFKGPRLTLKKHTTKTNN